MKKKAASSAPLPPTTGRAEIASRRLLLAVLAASLVLSCLFAARLPLDANPDEAAHRDYIRLIVEERGPVRFVEKDPARFETHQPPLYYLLCVPVYLATSGGVFPLRLVAALLQLLTIGVVYRAVRDLFPERPYLALAAAGFAAFLPTQAQLAGAINNDALTTLVCAALFWRLGLLVKAGQDLRGALVIGALLGIGLWTKLSVLQLLPAIVLAYGVAVRARHVEPKPAALHLAVTLGLALLIASPWLVRNTLLYGDPLTLKIYRSTGPNFTPAQIMAGFGWSFRDYLSQVGVRSFATFWYFLPPNLPPQRFTGSPWFLLIVLTIALGGLWGTYRWWRDADAAARRVVGLFLAGIFLLVPFFAQFVLTVFQAQGRYFLPALLPIALVTCLGWGTLAGRRQSRGALAVPALLLALTVYAVTGGPFYR